jgi:predicted protein tyrosine phosphatase
VNKWFKTKENVSYIVLPREAFKKKDNNLEISHAFISIHTPGDKAPFIATNDYTLGFMSLCFDDVDSEKMFEGINRKPILFNEQIAYDIIAFWAKINPKVFVIHCDAGFSRSPAVAAALTSINGDSDLEFFSRYRLNMLVYRTLIETAQKLKSL